MFWKGQQVGHGVGVGGHHVAHRRHRPRRGAGQGPAEEVHVEVEEPGDLGCPLGGRVFHFRGGLAPVGWVVGWRGLPVQKMVVTHWVGLLGVGGLPV